MSFFRCWSVRNILDLYIDGRLTPNAALRVKTHLASCEACREEREALAPAAMPEGGRVPVPDGLMASILEKLEQGEAPAAAPAGIGDALHLSPAQALSLAYCAILLSAHALPGGHSSQAYTEDAARVLEAQR